MFLVNIDSDSLEKRYGQSLGNSDVKFLHGHFGVTGKPAGSLDT
jgi:hypothetical protein